MKPHSLIKLRLVKKMSDKKLQMATGEEAERKKEERNCTER